MNEERLQILEMLQAGRITAKEAADLLAALSSQEPEQGVVRAGIEPASNPPNFERFRHFWRWPFALAGTITLLLGILLISMTRSADGRITLALICTWPLFMLGLLVTMLALWSRWATWVHVRVQEKGGRRIPISLPVPLGLGQWVLDLARAVVSEEIKGHLEMASHFLREMRHAPQNEPLMLDVNDDDGDHVQVYIG